MADNAKFVQTGKTSLSGSGITSTETTIILTSLKLVDGTTITMTDFGDTGYGVLEPGTSKEELVKFTGITQNADGTATLTTVTRGLKPVSPYTTDSTYKQAHSGGSVFVISNSAAFYNELLAKDNDETITGTWTFTSTARPVYDTHPTFSADEELIDKKYADDLAFAGSPDASTTSKGISEEATTAEVVAGTGAGSTSARLFVNPSSISDKILTADERTLVRAVEGTTTSTEINQLASTTNIAEADTFFGATDITGATVNNFFSNTPTAGADLTKFDIVKPNDVNNEVVKVAAQALGAFDTTVTEPDTAGYKKVIQLDNNKQVHYFGGYSGVVKTLQARVGTYNSAEDDIAYGSAVTISSSGGSKDFDVALIGTDKILVIWQGGTNGTVVRIHTISGTTISQGSNVTIEASGGQNQVSVAKLDTDKAIIAYSKNADSFNYVQVLTVSGTTITTNTPVLLDNQFTVSRNIRVRQIDTDKAIAVYSYDPKGLDGNIVTVSGTTPTIGALQTIIDDSKFYSLSLRKISSTKFSLAHYRATNTLTVSVLSISGDTITFNSGSTVTTATPFNMGYYIGHEMVGNSRILLSYPTSSTQTKYRLLKIDGTTVSLVEEGSVTLSSTTLTSQWIVKLRPWKYLIIGSNLEYAGLLTLTDDAEKKIGVITADVLETVTASISLLGIPLDGFTGLVAGSTYYIDDDGQPTLNASLVSPLYGTAMSNTKMFVKS